MAKKKKKTAKKATPKVEPKEPSMFMRGAVAVVLIVLAVVLIFGAFTEAPIPSGLWDFMWVIIGGSAFLLIPVLMYFGVIKFRTEEHKVPRAQYYSALALLVLFAGLLYALFQKQDVTKEGATLYGGEIGSLVGGTLSDSLGKILANVILIGLSVVLIFVLFKLHPRILLKPFSKDEDGTEDLADLKSRMPGFKLNEGVPTVNHSDQKAALGKMTALKATAQRVAPNTSDTPALTAASDPDWKFPSIELLSDKQDKADPGNIENNAQHIKEVFEQFNMEVEVEGANVGPRVTQYVVKPPTGVKMSKIEALDKNISLALASKSDVRIQAPIPGMRAVGLEVANLKSASVTLRGVMTSTEWTSTKNPLAFAVGKDLAGKPIIADLEDMPHLLIAGQTQSGKSVMLNTLLMSLLFRNSPADLKLILVDPKFVEMDPYKDIPHLISPLITEADEKCISALKWALAEMDRRLKAFAAAGQKNIQGYNKLKDQDGMPYIVIVIDELYELMMIAPRDVESMIARLTSKARAAGIHLVLATQRPDANVVTGLIKANVPAQIAFSVKDQTNSRIILDSGGAEKLLGKGDMLYQTSEINKPIRIQGAFVDGEEVKKICQFLRDQREPDYNDEILTQPVQLGKGGIVAPIGGNEDDNDKAWEDAVRVVIDSRKASTALLQRKLRIGYGRAARIIDQMEEQGIISTSEGGNKSREVLVSSMDEVFGSAEVASEVGDVYDEIELDDEEVKA